MKARLTRASDGVELMAINDSSNGCYITGEIDGLGPPPVRLSNGVLPGRPGGFSGRPLAGPRLVTVGGILIAETVPLMQSRRAVWGTAFSQLGQLELTIEYENGKTYLIKCQVIGQPSLKYRPLDPTKAPFDVELLANDPIIYDITDGSTNSVALAKAVGGGMVWPLTWPLTSSAGTGSSLAVNDSEFVVFPVIELNGSMTNPRLENETTGEYLQFSGLSTPTSASVLIDMYLPTITLDGGNISSYLAAGSGRWGLQSGPNSIRLTTGDADDTVSGTLSWRNGVMGI